jgi:fibronectin type 3 domain-containing protein
MKIAINIILTAIAIVLAINILSNIEKSQVDTIKETFMLERASENTYKLIPKNYGDDTITVKAQNAQVLYEVDELFGDTTYYYVFISNNKAINVVRGEKYRLQE